MLTSHEEAAKEAYENNMHHHGTMETIAKAYLNSRECSVQEAVYHVLPESKLRGIFPSVYFVNTNLPKEIVQVLLSKTNSLNYQMIAEVFSRNQILMVM